MRKARRSRFPREDEAGLSVRSGVGDVLFLRAPAVGPVVAVPPHVRADEPVAGETEGRGPLL